MKKYIDSFPWFIRIVVVYPCIALPFDPSILISWLEYPIWMRLYLMITLISCYYYTFEKIKTTVTYRRINNEDGTTFYQWEITIDGQTRIFKA